MKWSQGRKAGKEGSETFLPSLFKFLFICVHLRLSVVQISFLNEEGDFSANQPKAMNC
jgi:hypothetical protein